MGTKRRIYLVRHGESRGQTGETDDQRDPALSRRGVAQAQALAAVLAGVEFDTILVSPLRRAWQTFHLSGARGRQIRLDSRVIEHWPQGFYAGYEPEPPPDGLAKPDVHDAWRMDPAERARRLLEDVLADDAERVLLFGHFGLFRHIFRLFIGADMYAPHIDAMMDNTAISRLDVHADGRREVRFWNRLAGTMPDGLL